MSDILSFSPSTPPSVHVEALPSSAYLATAYVSVNSNGHPIACIEAWLPDDWALAHVDPSSNEEDSDETFIEEHCRHCKFYVDETKLNAGDLLDDEIEDEDRDEWDIIFVAVKSPCDAYTDGLGCVHFPCLMGHSMPTYSNDPESADLSAMCISVKRKLSPRSPLALDYEAFGIVLQKAAPVDDTWRSTSSLGCINTFNNGAICWGTDNDTPSSLLDAADTYADAPGNDDLLSPQTFFANNGNMKRRVVDQHCSPINTLHLPVPDDGDQHGLIVCSASINPQAFLLLTASGCQQKNGLAIALARWSEPHNGWLSYPLAGGNCWLVGIAPNVATEANEGILLGQLHTSEINTPSTPSTPCASHAPSSSEQAALAVS